MKAKLWLFIGLLMMINSANAYDVIKDEDKGLLSGIVEDDIKDVAIDEEEDIIAPDEDFAFDEQEVVVEEKRVPRIVIKKDNTNVITKTPYIPHVYPLKSDRKENDEQAKEWFKVPNREVVSVEDKIEENALVEELKKDINDCMENKKDNLNIERALMLEGNVFENTAYLTQTFEDINICYENIGYNIIMSFYDNDENVINSFEKKSKEFYVKATDTSFNPMFCEDECSLDALVRNQLDKFKKYRSYLSELLVNRP